MPFQVEQYTDGSSRSLDLTFISSGVPSIGYKTYYLVPTNKSNVFGNACNVKLETDDDARRANDTMGTDVVENEFYRVSVDRATAGIEIFDKELNQIVGKGIEIAAAEERGGDDQNIMLPTGRTIINLVDRVELEENSPVRAVLRIAENVGGVAVLQRLILYRGIKKIDLENTIDWKPGRTMNIEQVFPILQRGVEVRAGIPYGTVAAQEIMPQAGPRGGDEVAPEIWKGWRQIQDWVSAGTKEWGFTVSADHNLIEVSDTAIKADMLRGTRFSPATTVRNGQTVLDARPPAGTYVFRYSFTSGRGDWAAARSWRAGMAFSTPLIPVSSVNSLSEKPLPPEKSFLSVDADNIVVTAMKKEDMGDALVVRAFEITGKSAETPLLFLGQEHPFRRASLLERNLLTDYRSMLHLDPYEIGSLKISLP